jgi:hypothetical protein
MIRCVWIFCAGLCPGLTGVLAQLPELNFDENQLTETLQGLTEENALDLTEWNHRKPIRLQTVSAQELYALGLLLPQQVEALLQYRSENSPILSVYELQIIPEFDILTIRNLLPFLDAGEMAQPAQLQFQDFLSHGQHRLSLRWGWRERDQLQALRWNGSAHQLAFRHRYTYGTRIRWGITAEKDAGEALFRGANPQGFDHYSAHLFIRNPLPFLSALALGDYQVRLGQGLLLWQGLGLGKGPATLSIKRNAEPLLAHSSGAEAGFYRGAALRWESRKKRADVILFASRLRRDGRPFLGEDSEDFFVRSLPISGLHRTASELEGRRRVLQQSLGTSLSYDFGKLRMGWNALYERLDIPLYPAPAPFRVNYFRGNSLGGLSMDYRWDYRQFRFFGEIARNTEAQYAQLHGCQFSLHPRLDLGYLYRRYAPGYETFHSAAFGASSLPRNEEGLYIAVDARPSRKVRLQAYYDAWRHPWLRFQVNSPEERNNFLLRATYLPKRYWEYYLELRGNGTLYQLRAHASLRLSKSAEWRIRGNMGWLEGARGYTFHQDWLYRPVGKPWGFTARLAIIHTPGYDMRFYTYENELLYRFSMPAYYSQAVRSFLQIRFKGFRNWVLETRWGGTLWEPDNRNSRWQHELSAQAHYSF